MVDAMRAMLDELMGKERDVPVEKRKNEKLKFNDVAVCKYELCGLCPYSLFRNTKSDLGPCQFDVHNDHLDWEDLQKDWDVLDPMDKDGFNFELKLYRLLEQLVKDMDRKISRQKERAEKESQPKPIKQEDQARLDDLRKKMDEATERSGALGDEGDVDGAELAAQEAESLKKQYDNLMQQLTQPERTMTVCGVCGVFINSTDNEQRRKAQNGGVHLYKDHLNGKQYQGWKRIRDKHKELRKKFDRDYVDEKEEGEQEDGEEGPSAKDKIKYRTDQDWDRERDRSREGERPEGFRGGDRRRERDRDENDYRRDQYKRDFDRRERSRSPRDRYSGYRRGAPVAPPRQAGGYRGRRGYDMDYNDYDYRRRY